MRLSVSRVYTITDKMIKLSSWINANSKSKLLASEVGHSPPSSTNLKNGGAIPPLSIWPHDIVLNYIIK